jgi:hypothetical protein
MPSAVEICNLALGWCGADSIASLDEASVAGRLCKTNYPMLRDAVMEEANWSFAVQRSLLETPATPPPAFGWTSRYVLPSTVLRVVDVYVTESGDIDFVVEGREVLCDADDGVNLRAIHRVEDPTRFSPEFVIALAHRLASVLAVPLTENRSLQADHFQLYRATLRAAGTLDGMQGRGEQRRGPSDLEAVRR